MTSNQTEAEDLTQEVFIQLFRRSAVFAAIRLSRPGCIGLTVNQVLMHFRRRSVKNERTSEDGEMPEQTVTARPTRTRCRSSTASLLKNAIAELPNGYRNVFILHDVEGFEHEEVARMMGISVGTSKSQLHKATTETARAADQAAGLDNEFKTGKHEHDKFVRVFFVDVIEIGQ